LHIVAADVETTGETIIITVYEPARHLEQRLQEQGSMKCVICKHGEPKQGTTTVTLERGTATLVIKDVPAQVCTNCGEAYFDGDVTDSLLDMLNTAVETGVQVEIRAYPMPQTS
jgi:YgiT-type zinc finger domain-containing protein